MNADRNKLIAELGEREGYVIGLESDRYRVALYTPTGWRYYQFPRSIAREPLAAGNAVKCYAVENGNRIETKLERLDEEQDLTQAEADFLKEVERFMTKIKARLRGKSSRTRP